MVEFLKQICVEIMMIDELDSKQNELKNSSGLDEAMVENAEKLPIQASTQDIAEQRNWNHIFFETPRISSDQPFRSLLCTAAGLIGTQLSPIHIKPALLTACVMISNRLGHPMAESLVSDEPARAVKIIDSARHTVPEDAIAEFQKIKPEMLFLGAESLKGKAVVCTDPAGFKKAEDEIWMLLTRGTAMKQEIIKTKYGVGLHSFQTDLEISFVGVSRDGCSTLKHPSILNVPIPGDSSSVRDIIQASEGDRQVDPVVLEVERARIRKTFHRLVPRRVEIPFLDGILHGLARQCPENLGERAQLITKLISIMTIMNNPPPVYQDELFSAMYGINKEKVGNWLVALGQGSRPRVDLGTTLVANKIDYYVAWLLMKGILKQEANGLTIRQRRILEGVKRINIGKAGQAFAKKTDEVEMLSMISAHDEYWATREKIFEEVNKDSPEFISLSTVTNELQEIIKKGCIERCKMAKGKTYGYFVLCFDPDRYITLPKPSDIGDPFFSGKMVEVVNPLTGAIDKI